MLNLIKAIFLRSSRQARRVFRSQWQRISKSPVDCLSKRRRSVRIDGKDHFVAVMFAVNKGYKESCVRRAEHILQNASAQVVAQPLPHRLQVVLQQAAIARMSRGAGVLLDFIIGAVGEAHHHLLEVLHKLRVLGEKFQAGTLRCEGRLDSEPSIPDEQRTRYFPCYRSQKTN